MLNIIWFLAVLQRWIHTHAVQSPSRRLHQIFTAPWGLLTSLCSPMKCNSNKTISRGKKRKVDTWRAQLMKAWIAWTPAWASQWATLSREDAPSWTTSSCKGQARAALTPRSLESLAGKYLLKKQCMVLFVWTLSDLALSFQIGCWLLNLPYFNSMRSTL